MSELLVVDSEPEIANAIRRELVGTAWCVTAEADPTIALGLIGGHAFDVVIAENWLEGMPGVEFLTRVRRHDPGIVRIILSAHADTTIMMQSVNKAAIFRYIVKPWEPEELKEVLFEAEIQRHRQLQTQTALRRIQLRELEEAYEKSRKDD